MYYSQEVLDAGKRWYKNTLITIFLVLATIVISVLRFFVPGHDLSWPGTYEAFAHILVGMLIMNGIRAEKYSWWLLGGATALETIMFLLR